MINKSIIYLLITLSIAASGCSSIAGNPQDDSPNPTITPIFPSEFSQTPAPDSSTPQTLKIWIPQEFDPYSDTPAGLIFQDRLSEFIELYPGIHIEVRLKESSSTNGLFNAIISAAAAAPLSLPDLVLLSRADLEMAAKSDVIYPLDNLINNPEDPDWYDFAKRLALVDSQIYGFPFAANALLVAYNNENIIQPPSSWAETIQTNAVLAFPSAHPAALFTIAQYQSLGGELKDQSGNLQLSAEPLSSVFNFYKSAMDSGVFPVWLTLHDSYETTWQSLQTKQSDMVVTWSNQFLFSSHENYSAAPIPTQDGRPYTLTTGWVWALASPIASRHSLSIELAEYLTESKFQSEWTFAAGFLPLRPTALAEWPQGSRQALASQIIPSAQLIPDSEALNVLGPMLSDLVVRILKGEIDISAAVERALEFVSQS